MLGRAKALAVLVVHGSLHLILQLVHRIDSLSLFSARVRPMRAGMASSLTLVDCTLLRLVTVLACAAGSALRFLL